MNWPSWVHCLWITERLLDTALSILRSSLCTDFNVEWHSVGVGHVRGHLRKICFLVAYISTRKYRKWTWGKVFNLVLSWQKRPERVVLNRNVSISTLIDLNLFFQLFLDWNFTSNHEFDYPLHPFKGGGLSVIEMHFVELAFLFWNQ